MSYVDDNFGEFIDKTFTKIERGRSSEGNDALTFTTSEGEVYRMTHEQDCCESVGIDSIIGDLDSLIGHVILKAEERIVCNEDPDEVTKENDDFYYDESFTWTIYTLATSENSATIKWLGSSNGYYSESVYLIKGKDNGYDEEY